MVGLLRESCRKAGGQSAWAKAACVRVGYVNDVLSGRRKPGDSILRGLGVEKLVIYRKVRGKPPDKSPAGAQEPAEDQATHDR